ncbi:MAG: fibronectin type III domain-containing protein [Acidobacteria bacterium]|nr:MAG: fibronectin type III domain-containing protein [Acidobacteriota bacterium]
MKLIICCVLLSLTLGAQTRWRSGQQRSPHYHGLTSQVMSPPQVSGVTVSGFTVSWTTTQALSTELLYGAGNLNQVQNHTALTEQHSVTLTGLQPATTYEFEAVSTDAANINLRSKVGTVTTAAAPPPPPPPTTGTRLFPAAAADWLYSPPTGTPLNISSIASAMGFHLNTHDGGYDYPVQYTDGTHGCTTFTDTLIYSYNKDNLCVPNPANGYHPSVGGWGADDGHVVIVDTATGNYYDFWKLYVNSSFQPTSTNVGKIVEGSLNGDGTPGTTAAQVTGLAGDILPGELACVTCLNHALNVVVPGNMNNPKVCTQFPAKATDGSVPGAIFCEGAKIRFDPSIDVNTLSASTAVKAIMRALQLYGGAITDQTGSSNVLIYTDLPSQPDTTGIGLIGQHLWLYY